MFATFVLHDEIHCRRLHAFLRANWLAMAQAGKPLGVMVAEHKSKRSNPQNKLYWAVLHTIAEGGWVNGKQFSADAWHENFKREFIGIEELPNGATTGISTASLDVGAFSDYIERVMHYAAEHLGVTIE